MIVFAELNPSINKIIVPVLATITPNVATYYALNLIQNGYNFEDLIDEFDNNLVVPEGGKIAVGNVLALMYDGVISIDENNNIMIIKKNVLPPTMSLALSCGIQKNHVCYEDETLDIHTMLTTLLVLIYYSDKPLEYIINIVSEASGRNEIEIKRAIDMLLKEGLLTRKHTDLMLSDRGITYLAISMPFIDILTSLVEVDMDIFTDMISRDLAFTVYRHYLSIARFRFENEIDSELRRHMPRNNSMFIN